jgi:hypothetical protein
VDGWCLSSQERSFVGVPHNGGFDLPDGLCFSVKSLNILREFDCEWSVLHDLVGFVDGLENHALVSLADLSVDVVVAIDHGSFEVRHADPSDIVLALIGNLFA